MNNINSVYYLCSYGKTREEKIYNFISALVFDDKAAAMHTKDLISEGAIIIGFPRRADITIEGNIMKATTYDLWAQNPLYYEINLEEDYMTSEEITEKEIKRIIEKIEEER